jgi:hypothetical protein
MFSRKFQCLLICLCWVSSMAIADVLDGLSDPTRPLMSKLSPADVPGEDRLLDGLMGMLTSYTVSSILVSDARKIAIVNGTQVTEGSEIDNAKVIAIERASVTLEVDQETIKVFVAEGRIKTPRL